MNKAPGEVQPKRRVKTGMGGPILLFEYQNRSGALLLDGKVFTVGIPAKILRKIVRGYARGRSSFDHLSFKYDPDIFSSPKGTNFVVRLGRIQARLAEVTSRASLEKTGKGEFAFRADVVVRFRDLA